MARRRRALAGIIFLAVGLLTIGWLLNTPVGLLGKADAVGYAVCHRIDLRSFHLGDRQLPFCARCSGMYLGAALGLVLLGIQGRRRAGLPSRKMMALLGLLVLAFAGDGLNSYLHFFPGAPRLYEPQNWSRLLTGTGMGLVLAVTVLIAFNQTVWRPLDLRPVLSGWKPLAALLGLAAILDLLVLTENPAILYPLALVSAASVVLILTIVYGLAWVMLLRRENRIHSWTHLIWPFVMGFGIAILQIAVLDLVRYWLTGTWEGFHLGF